MPTKALADPRIRGILLDWRDELALSSKRQADYTWTVLAKILSTAKDRGKITVNPCERGGRVYHGTRVDSVWTEDQEAAFLATAAPHLHLPLLLGLWTGQRQGDLLRLTWKAYDGQDIRLKQSKTGARVVIPVGVPLKDMLDATLRKSPIILVNTWPPVDARRVPGIVLQGPRRSRHYRRDIQRSPRDCSDAARPGGLYRGADRYHHRPQLGRRALNPRRPLPAP
jgi:integrase